MNKFMYLKLSLVCILVFVLCLATVNMNAGNNDGLTADPQNHCFTYKGKTYIPIGSGTTDISTKIQPELISKGVNQFSTMVVPLVNTMLKKGRNIKEIPADWRKQKWDGWNEGYFEKIGKLAQDLEANDCTLFLIVFSTCMRRQPPRKERNEGRFHDHLWNKANGGVLDPDKGITEFYNWDNPGYGKVNQIAQEAIVGKIIEAVNGRKNVGIVLQWEIFSGWSAAKPWAQSIIPYIKIDCGFSGPVGIGAIDSGQIQELTENLKKNTQLTKVWPDLCIFGNIEAYNPRLDIPNNTCGLTGSLIYPLPDQYPMLFMGYHPVCGAYYFKNKQTRCAAIAGGQEKEIFVNSALTMIDSIKRINSCSLPFAFYWFQKSDRLESDCASYKEKFELGLVKNALLKFTEDLAKTVKNGGNLDKYNETVIEKFFQ